MWSMWLLEVEVSVCVLLVSGGSLLCSLGCSLSFFFLLFCHTFFVSGSCCLGFLTAFSVFLFAFLFRFSVFESVASLRGSIRLLRGSAAVLGWRAKVFLPRLTLARRVPCVPSLRGSARDVFGFADLSDIPASACRVPSSRIAAAMRRS